MMGIIDLNSTAFREKVYGCWLGKNCGGTLGAPLEKMWGEAEMFDVWWYPQLQEGGIPNDDLEMQLIWLKALEEVGPHIKAADLARYWLDHIGYNWDEYGLSKTNLRLGLLPPVSGFYNNWFKNCMGSPIRSEIWACVAPGIPSIAVRFAYEDALCDHAGGEGVFGSLFNAAVESAAFVVDDREQLIEIGLSYIPPSSETAKAIVTARAAYAASEDWKTARTRIMQAVPDRIAQYAPLNLGFQVLGWLYGEDFGDAICKAVNCGYDTDCTGATLGSILGILAGQRNLPEKWTAPLGEAIATNESWGGIRHTSDGSNPIPVNLIELTDRVCAMAKRVLSAHGRLQDGALVQIDPDPEKLKADEKIRALWEVSPLRLDYQSGTIPVMVDYRDTPVCVPGEDKTLLTSITNPHPDPIRVNCELYTPDGWQTGTRQREVTLSPHSSTEISWIIPVPPAPNVDNTNTLYLAVQPLGYSAQPAIPLVLIGARKYRYAGPYTREEQSAHELLDQVFEPETLNGSFLSQDSRAGIWNECTAFDNALPFGKILANGGALYVQAYLWSPAAYPVWMGTATTCPAKYWVNGTFIAESFVYRPLRPQYGGLEETGCFAHVQLLEGWNEVLLKFARTADAPAFEGHFLWSTADDLHNGLPEIRWTRLPWDQ
jgi:ADP-ribosylglycohydrolase